MLAESELKMVLFDSSVPKHQEYLTYIIAIESAEGWEILDTDLASFTASKQVNMYFILRGEECVGSVSLLSSPEDRFIALGALIVAPDYRTKGIGHWAVDWCVKEAADQCVALLTMQENIGFYAKSGFKETGAAVAGYALELPPLAPEVSESDLTALSAAQKEAILAYDHSITGLSRGRLLMCMLERSTFAIGSFDDAGKAVGYAFARPFNAKDGGGFRIALYADGTAIFRDLLSKMVGCLSQMTDSVSIHITSPVQKQEALEAHGFKHAYGPCPFMTTMANTTGLHNEKTWCILTEEFS